MRPALAGRRIGAWARPGQQSRLHVLGQLGPQGIEWRLVVPLAIGTLRRCSVAAGLPVAVRLARRPKLRRGRQGLDGRRLVVQAKVRVDAHRESDVAVPGQRLGFPRGDADVLQVRDERVPVRVEVGIEPCVVLVLEEVGLPASGLPDVQGKRAVRHVLFDTDYWKSFVQARLSP